MSSIDFNHPTKSLLQQEQELLNEGFNEDDLSRFYPNVLGGNGHHPECVCSICDPEPDHCSKCGETDCDGGEGCQPPPVDTLPPVVHETNMTNWYSQGHPNGICTCANGVCLYEHPF